ncbi:hypothetical protein [Amycolatopsis jiangsuensis]|uniref:PE family protein n=1 Tax=Amycolatopsis jiangsuensis TaxID=1181879 RepID=A0A840IRL5_9PSEU|nr:hypothetical protein [Amycolatopsis jiangsuensis]MBB4683674.1 hypothetical protein [Amycolatopsis jiangsuensis]
MSLGKGTALVNGAAEHGGSGFAMDAAELTAVIRLWEDELGKVTADGHAIDEILTVFRAPAADPASTEYAAAGADSLRTLREQNDSMRRYVEDYLGRLRTARDRVVEVDRANADLGRAR